MLHFIKKYYIQLSMVTLFFVVIIIMIVQSFNIIGMIREKSAQLKQTQLDYILAGEFLNNIYTFKQNTAYIDAENAQLSTLLPNDDDEKVRLFSFLEKLAKDTGNNSITLSVKSADPAKAKKGEVKKDISNITPATSDFMNIEITLVGNYDDLVEFVTRLENMQYFSDILSLHTIKTDSDISRVNINENGEPESKIKRNDLLKTTMNVVFYLEPK